DHRLAAGHRLERADALELGDASIHVDVRRRVDGWEVGILDEAGEGHRLADAGCLIHPAQSRQILALADDDELDVELLVDRGQSADYLVDALVAIEAADNQTGRTIGDAEQGETPSVRRTGTKPRQVDAAGDRGRRRGDSMLANQLGSV